MKIRFYLALLAFSIYGNVSIAQHAGDLEIWYDDINSPSQLLFEVDETTSEGIALFESEFEDENSSFPNAQPDWAADEPGFDTNPAFGITEDHQIWLHLLDASAHSDAGVGHLNFFGRGDTSLNVAGDLAVLGNPSPVSAPGLRLEDGVVASGSLRQYLGAGDSNAEIHEHITFDLINDENSDAAIGAYGLLFQLESHIGGFDGIPEIVSDPFWIVINRGLSENEFENLAVPAFSISAVPEPTSAVLFLAGIAGLAMKRRRAA